MAAVYSRLYGSARHDPFFYSKRLFVNDQATAQVTARDSAKVSQFRKVLDGSGYAVQVYSIAPAADFEETVQPGHACLLGDSRDFGQVPLDHVMGRVVCVFVP